MLQGRVEMRGSLILAAGLQNPYPKSLGPGPARSVAFGQNRIVASKAFVGGSLFGTQTFRLGEPSRDSHEGGSQTAPADRAIYQLNQHAGNFNSDQIILLFRRGSWPTGLMVTGTHQICTGDRADGASW